MKKRLILNRIITFVIGIAVLILGIDNNEQMIYMGAAMIIAAIAMTIKTVILLKDKEKLKKYENGCKDERNIFIAQKSYSFAFWVSVYCEFIAMCVYSYLKMGSIASAIAYVICGQIIIYAAAWHYFRRKY